MLYKYNNIIPDIDPTAYVAPTATVLGDVIIGAGSSVWFGAVLRGDIDRIRVGTHSSIQDNVTVHVTGGIYPTLIGNNVIVGHGAILHGCTLEDRCLIGMGAVILDNAVIGKGAMVAAGALVRENQVVPPETLVAGVPATVRRNLNEDDRQNISRILNNYERETAFYLENGIEPV